MFYIFNEFLKTVYSVYRRIWFRTSSCCIYFLSEHLELSLSRRTTGRFCWL